MRTRFPGLCWVCWARILALMLLMLLAAKALAEPVEASPAQPLVPPEDAPLADGTRERIPPDYRGQEPPPTTTGDVLIWDRGSSSSRPIW